MPSVKQQRVLAKQVSDAVGFVRQRRTNAAGYGSLVYAWGTNRHGKRGGASVSPSGTVMVYSGNLSRRLDVDDVSLILDEKKKASDIRAARGW